MPETIIVVPCFEEERRLPVADFEAFAAANPDVGFLLVDDGSGDGTLDLLRGLETRYPGSFTVLARDRNGGKAEAVRSGVLQALTRDPAYVGYWDADLSTPLDAIADLRAELGADPGLEFVIGSRVLMVGCTIERRALRHYLGRVFATFASLTLRMPIYDTQCGAKLFRVLPGLAGLFEEPFVTGWSFDVEILARLLARRGREETMRVIRERPLRVWRDVPGTKVRPLDSFRALRDLRRIRRRYLRGVRAPNAD